MEVSELLKTIEDRHRDAKERRLFFQSTTDERLSGRQISIDDRELLSFGSCSYLGLEFHPALREGVRDAVDRYGTQFSSSRGYVSAPPYAELEALLSRMFDAHVLVAASTTLAHLSALPVLATEKDAIVADHQVHQSVQQAMTIARAGGAHVEIVRHEELEKALEVVARLASRYRTVWFTTDGVTSMYGDHAPTALLTQLLEVAPNVRLYIDDAHGMSWAGQHGRGAFLSRMAMSPRIVVATSLNKAFAASGACLVFTSQEEMELVRICGGPMLFSGPLQPPMLGAAVASAKVHLSGELPVLQAALKERVEHANHLIEKLDLPALVRNDVPIKFIRLGIPRVASEVAQRMAAEGIYVNVSMYPTVPMRRAGIRLSINANHTFSEIERAVTALARHVPAVLSEEQMSREELDTLFAKTVVSHLGRTPTLPPPSRSSIPPTVRKPRPVTSEAALDLGVEWKRTIDQVDRETWNRLMGTRGTSSWDSLRAIEALFSEQPLAEHNWAFDYVIIRDASGKPVAATYFTTSLQKDDFLMRQEVSKAVEERRRDDPYFLSSRVVMTGSAFSEGDHLYVDRSGPWQAGLERLLIIAEVIYSRNEGSVLMLRDLPADDPEMDALLLDQGLVKTPMLDSHVLDVDWTSEEGFLARLGRSRRGQMRKIMASRTGVTRRVYGAGVEGPAMDQGLVSHLHHLYRQVARRKLRLNVFELPEDTLPVLLTTPAWEVVTLSLSREAGGPAHELPVAWYAAHKHAGHYAPFCAGLDYDYVGSKQRSAYRQLLLAAVMRGAELGASRIHLGMDADIEKRRLGTRVVESCIYVQARDHYHGAVMRDIVSQISLRCPDLFEAGSVSAGAGA
jgi:7-keto-8-aminopelargonate synthetase-like enzyme